MTQQDLSIWDREDGRKVYQLGLQNPPANDDPKRSHHLGAYTDGDMSFPAQWWLSRGTSRPGPFKRVRTPAEIVAQNLMFPFGDTGAPYGTVSAIKYELMGSSSLTKYMPTTGERRDIGLVTDWFAWYMLTGDLGPALEIAQAIESFPIFFTDQATSKPIDLLKYPKANCYESPAQGAPWFSRFPLKPDPDPDKPGEFVADIGDGNYPQQAHFPEASYGAHIATGDLGFLENLQYSANFSVLCDASHSTPTQAILTGELRGISWGWRNLLMAWRATLDLEIAYAAVGSPWPPFLHPSSYFKTLLNNSVNYFKPAVTDPNNQVFRLVFGPGSFAPWQCDYMLTVLAFAVLVGYDDLVQLFLWAFKNVYDRALGDQGYPLGMGGGSYFDGTQPSWTAAVADMYVQSRAVGDARFTDAQLQQLIANPFNNYTTIYDGSYHLNTRAVLVMGQYLHKLGLVDMSISYPRLDECFTNLDRFVRTGGYMVPRASIVLDNTNSPPPIIPQPPTEIEMSDTKLAIGETKHITIAITPPDADQTGLAYTVTPDGLVTLAPDTTGVSVTRTAKGTATIEADLNGLKATAEALDAIPLADAIALSWDS